MIYCKGYNISLNDRHTEGRIRVYIIKNQLRRYKISNTTTLKKENVRVGSVHTKTYGWHGGIGPCINLGTRWR